VTNWCYRWLSIEGGLTLVKSVLEGILVYWLSLSHIPKGILEKIRKKCFSFLWVCKREKEGMPLVKWKKLAKPKEAGG
jgi:hypothetical protein